MIIDKKIVILGAGIAGLSCAYHLRKKGIESTIYEKKDTYGGLCGSFKKGDYIFDKFIHLSFTNNEYVKKIFSKSTDYFIHEPNPICLYKDMWIKHPVQHNLYILPTEMKIKIIKDFCRKKEIKNIINYEEWLKDQYGNFFYEEFPKKYTKKYWTVNPCKMETKWIGKRMKKLNIEELLYGSFEKETKNNYYAKEMRYPKYGGYKSFLKELAENLNIKYNKQVVSISPKRKKVYFSDGTYKSYDILVSSLPLTEISVLFEQNSSLDILNAAENLSYTSGLIISLGFNKKISFNNLWIYIYNEDILPARIYFPNNKSINNVPLGCSSLQAEIYFSKFKKLQKSYKTITKELINKLAEINLFSKNDLDIVDYRVEPYANVIFDHKIYKNRKKILDFLNSYNIFSIGRFGEWDYFWSDQSFISGLNKSINIQEEYLNAI